MTWRNQKLQDALSFQKNPEIPELFESLLKNPSSPVIQTEIIHIITLLQSVNQYDILFIDTKGKTLFTYPKTADPLCENVIEHLPDALMSSQITFVDLHLSPIDKKINMSLLVPIQKEESNVTLGFINLRIDPALYLYPMLQKWPNDSRTAETLLVRKDGENVLYLNELRFRNDSALKLRIHLTNLKTPAVQAVLGRIGYFEGLDYRGESVVSELRPIPNSPWYMVARLDKSELFAPLYARTRQLVFWLLLLAIAILAFLIILFQKNRNQYHRDLEAKRKISQEYENKVRIANEKANLYLSLVGSIIVVIDKNEKVTMINEAGCKLLGYSQEEIVGKNWFDHFLVQQDIAIVKDTFSQILSGHLENVEYFENQIVTKEGIKKDIAWHNNILKNPLGEIVGTVSSGEDITERKHFEKELQESEKRFRAIFENSTVGNSLTSPQGKLLKINKAFVDMLGYTIEEIESINFADITYPEDIPDSKEQIRKLMAGEKKIVKFEKRYLHKSSRIVWTDISSTLFHNSTGEPLFLITSIVDITARKRAESALVLLNEELEQKVKERTVELQASNKELEAFAYSVSHDLRAPLRAIDGFSHMLLDEYSKVLDDEGKRLLQTIRKSAHNMDLLIYDLLNMAKVTRSVMKKEPIPMKEMSQSVYDELPREDTRNIFFTVEPLAVAFGDSALIRQVWVNLIQNAVKFTNKKEKRTITIKSTIQEDFLIFIVSDNGVGFKQQYANKLFEAFQRLHSVSEFEGTGIGLALVERIIHRHGGQVWAEGEEGQGATFYFSLPIKKEG